ncbi:hypothetical protein Tsubulata_051584, partial [Turnera subulata]
MVQIASSFSALTIPPCTWICASIQPYRRRRRSLKLIREEAATHIPAWNCCQSPLHQRNVKVEAGWLFNKRGRQQGWDASSERSETANEDILIFFFQLDLATRVQCALNMEEYDSAQKLRNKLTERRLSSNENQRGDHLQRARLKIRLLVSYDYELQKAVENENYTIAAELRDQISKLEAESLAASATALAYENAQYAFRLGQKVKHKIFGIEGGFCGLIRTFNSSFSLHDSILLKIMREILSLSSNCVKSIIGLGMNCQWIHRRTVEVMLK